MWLVGCPRPLENCSKNKQLGKFFYVFIIKKNGKGVCMFSLNQMFDVLSTSAMTTHVLFFNIVTSSLKVTLCKTYSL